VEVAGRLAVVTGASSGIGAATVRALAAERVRLVLMARRAEPLEQLANEIRSTGGEAYAVAADLGQHAAVAAAAERVLGEIGVPDVIVNNAGAGRFLFIDETDPEEAVQMMAVPYFATFFVTRAFIEPMLQRGSGTILMVNSPVAIVPWPGAIGYAAARYAVRGFTDALRQDLRGTGLRVSSVTPAEVSSGYFDANPGAAERVPKIGKLLVGTMTSEQVAEVIVGALRRDARDVYPPLRWGVIEPFARAVPRPVEWLYAKTGARRREPLTRVPHEPGAALPELNTKGSVQSLQRAFRDAPAPELGALVGRHEAEYAGPAWLRLSGPLTMRLTGMPGWWGKAFRPPTESADALEGENVLRRRGRLEPSVSMRARLAPSRVDGRPALVVSYPADAPFPWRQVNDELRPLDDRTMLGLTFGIPGAPRGGSPFVLHRREGAP
jgi:short-subunit dehydrogenase